MSDCSDPAIFALETERIFRRRWIPVCLSLDVPERSVIHRRLADEPILVTRSQGVVRAFSATCRHRGMLVGRSGSQVGAGALRCDYHCWDYSSESGLLMHVPKVFGALSDLDNRPPGLTRFGCVEVNGLILVRLDGDAELDHEDVEYFATVRDPVSCGLVPVYRETFTINANWKLIVENHLDIPHLSFLHRESLGMYDHSAIEELRFGAHWCSVEHLTPDGYEKLHVDRRGMPVISSLSGPNLTQQRADHFFPSLLQTASPTRCCDSLLFPVSVGQTDLELVVWGEPSSNLTEEGLRRLMRVLRDEDWAAVECLQQCARNAPFEDQLVSAHCEANILQFRASLSESLSR